MSFFFVVEKKSTNHFFFCLASVFNLIAFFLIFYIKNYISDFMAGVLGSDGILELFSPDFLKSWNF
jgi:hypothetical protein